MDANNTKYHLLHGERDWIPVLVNQPEVDIWWDRGRKSVSLAPIIQQLDELEHDQLLEQDLRRGAAYDHYGNIYWINEQRNGIDYQPAATPLQIGQFWHVDELNRSPILDQGHGDFQSAPAIENLCEPNLSGLAITTLEYLVVGTLSPAGIMVFDLHAGGPPNWLRWPEQVPFYPWDMSCTPDGGFWILDRNFNTGDAGVWRLDQNFRVLDSNGEVVALESGMSNDFYAEHDSETQHCSDNRFYSGISLNLASPALVDEPVAIETLSDSAFIIMSAPQGGGSSAVYYFDENQLLDSVTLDEESIGGLVTNAEIKGHDFAFLPNHIQDSNSVSGALYVAATTATQSFEFALRARNDELKLVMQPKLLPMREYSGRALIASGKHAVYDFAKRVPGDGENALIASGKPARQDLARRWLPLTEQPRPRFHKEAQIEGIVKDGAEPDCVWHRIIMDACIPGGTGIIVESRAADDTQSLQELPWQLEPRPYLRTDGSELPLHQAFDDFELQPDTMGSWDLLLQNAVGRYLELRLTLRGTQRLTPRLRSLRIYYPRYSYLDRHLPAVYREDLISANFLDRFLANVEGLFTSLEDKIASAQYLFDTRSTPAEFLDWLGAWLGAFMDPTWDDNRKRLFIDNAYLLFRWRGTPLGLWVIIKLTISDCPDESIFEPLNLATPTFEGAFSGRDVRIVEDFLTRGFAGISLAEAQQTTALVSEGSKTAWEPAMGAGVLQQRFRRFLALTYEADSDRGLFEETWGKKYSRLDSIVFPPLTPAQEARKRDWRIFTRDFLGFSYSEVTNEDLPLYQEFLARRYQQIDRFNTAHGLAGVFKRADFSEISLPAELSRNTTALSDWIEFVSLVLPIKEQAHQFTVLLPTVLGELPSTMERRRAQVKEIVQREKPAHTEFEVKYFWALFQVGSARLGLDTSLGEGSRFVAMVLGANFLGQSFLAESHPWSVVDRSILGRDRLGKEQ